MKTIVAIWHLMVIGMFFAAIYFVYGTGWMIASIVLVYGSIIAIAIFGGHKPPPEE